MSIVTHECRSSITKDILAPFSRYTDRKMSIVSLAKSSKLGMLFFLTKLAGGRHIKLKSFSAQKATEAIICPTTQSYFNIDGEIFEDDEAHVVSLPGFLNLMGQTHSLTPAEDSYAKELK